METVSESKQDVDNNITNLIPKEEVKEQQNKIFKNFNIYVEIFNNSIDQSDLLDEALNANGAKVVKKLIKGIDYIVFKEGKNKTIEHALTNKIKIVNPLWVHDSIDKNELMDSEKYIIKKNFTELFIASDNRKRKYDQVSKSPDKKSEINSMKKKISHIKPDIRGSITITNKEDKKDNSNSESENISNNLATLSTTTTENTINIQNNKITNFFKPAVKAEVKPQTERKSLTYSEPLICVSSLGIGEEGKFRVNSCVKALGKYSYSGESLENIKQSEYVVVSEVLSKNDIKYFYCMISNKKMIRVKYFTDSKTESKYKTNLDDYIKQYQFDPKDLEDLKSKDDLPFKTEKYKFFLHPSLYEQEPMKKDILVTLLSFIGAEIENNIRLSDICVINKENINEHFPGHVKLLNENFLFDCFYNSKVMDMENMKYFPEKVNIKKPIK